MSPAEAGAIELEEPDWRERFEAHALRWPRLPRYLAEDNAFEATMKDWRRFHRVEKQTPSAVEAMIALAILNIYPPRFLIKDVPRTDDMGYQQDEHMWLSIRGEQWRITGVEDRILHLEKRYEDKPETMQIDLNRAKWGKYVEAATALLDHLRGLG